MFSFAVDVETANSQFVACIRIGINILKLKPVLTPHYYITIMKALLNMVRPFLATATSLSKLAQ